MKILILGGTQFVGRFLVEAAIKNKHEVTLYNRGITNPGLFPALETLVGDRNGSLSELKGHAFDCVIDVSGYLPRVVGASADCLKESVKHYVFISTGAVYKHQESLDGCDETFPLKQLEDPSTEVCNGQTYGGLKVLCEQQVVDRFPENHLIVRPGIIAGPWDPTDRATYWVSRVASGGDILAPGSAEDSLQFIDIRDLSDFVIKCIESRTVGTYNATGPSVTWQEWFEACETASQSHPRYQWVEVETFLSQQTGKTRPYGSLPMALPNPKSGAYRKSSRKAQQCGLQFRSLEDTARSLLAWDESRPASTPKLAGLGSEEERLLLEKWCNQDGGQGGLPGKNASAK